jgi:hypothetical protein
MSSTQSNVNVGKLVLVPIDVWKKVSGGKTVSGLKTVEMPSYQEGGSDDGAHPTDSTPPSPPPSERVVGQGGTRPPLLSPPNPNPEEEGGGEGKEREVVRGGGNQYVERESLSSDKGEKNYFGPPGTNQQKMKTIRPARLKWISL